MNAMNSIIFSCSISLLAVYGVTRVVSNFALPLIPATGEMQARWKELGIDLMILENQHIPAQ